MKKVLPLLLGFISLLLVAIFLPEQKSIRVLPEIDYVLVEKRNRILSVYHQGRIIEKYSIALGFSPIGHKEREGDGKTPEGKYYIAHKNPKSNYHLSLKISYPSETDKLFSRRKGYNPGRDIMIHGLRKGFGWIGHYHKLKDWTRGCIAVANDEMEEIYYATKVGTIIEIIP